MQMKTKFKITIGVVLGLVCLVLLTPQLIEFDKIKSRVLKTVAKKVEGTLAVDHIQWDWFPVPHITLLDASYESDSLSLKLPRSMVYPDWWSFLRKDVEVGEVVLFKPELTVKHIPSSLPDPQTPLPLPRVSITVQNGALHLAENSRISQARVKKISIASIDMDANINRNNVKFTAKGVPSFGKKIKLAGEFLRDGSYYKLQMDSREIRLHEAFHALADKALVPVESFASFKASVEGRGLEVINASLVGELPCFLAYPTDKRILLNCGFVDLSMVKSGGDLLFAVNDFELREPGLKLSGEVRRQAAGREDGKPLWSIDLAGESLNLTQIREALLTMWGSNNEVVDEVCDIVLGGSAGKASYTFKGAVEDFEDIRAMTITADEIDATIQVPAGDLLLINTRGKLLIDQGVLRVSQGTAKLGNSYGRNCELALGMTSDDHTFVLDLDIDADVTDLPGVLNRLVEDKDFLAQLALFSKATGKAQAHLHVGEDLRALEVTVNVSSMQGHADYGPLVWDFTIDGGTLDVLPDRVSWKDVHGSYGRNRILKSSGHVLWNGRVFVDIGELQAEIYGPELELGDISYFKALDRLINENLQMIDGTLQLARLQAAGFVDAPEDWKIAVDLIFDQVDLETPHTPAPIHTFKGRLSVADNVATITEFSGTMLDSPFTMKGVVRMDADEDFSGRVTFSCLAGTTWEPWLKELALIPPALFPQLPMHGVDVTVNWNREKADVEGILRIGKQEESLPQVVFAVQSIGTDTLSVALNIKGLEEQAQIGIDFLDDDIPETFLFTWKGNLSQRTVQELFADKELLQGSVAGDFQIVLPSDPKGAVFNGELFAKDLRWYFSGPQVRYVDAEDLHFTGSGDHLKVEHLLLRFKDDEAVELSGPIRRTPNGLAVKLDLRSPSLSRKTIFGFLDDIAGVKEQISDEPAGIEEKTESWHVTGTVDFDLKEFISGKQAEGASGTPAQPLVWSPLQGEITLHPGWEVSANIVSGRLCCLDTTGEWFSDPALGGSHFTVNSHCEPKPRFEKVLPCLGYPQDLIEGEFSMDGDLIGVLDNWQDGSLDIHSEQGRILRMGLLAKIFKVINITDYFVEEKPGEYAGMEKRGFPYSEFTLKTHVKDNEMIIDEAVILGEGLNIFAQGKMNIVTFDMDITVMIAPLKSLDAIISKVPLVGTIVGGDKASIFTIPVAVTGNMRDPDVTVLAPSAIGKVFLDMVKRTLLLPFTILQPILPDAKPDADPAK